MTSSNVVEPLPEWLADLEARMTNPLECTPRELSEDGVCLLELCKAQREALDDITAHPGFIHCGHNQAVKADRARRLWEGK